MERRVVGFRVSNSLWPHADTRTTTGLRVKAKLDKRRYATSVVVTRAERRDWALHPHAFHGDWNYELRLTN